MSSQAAIAGLDDHPKLIAPVVSVTGIYISPGHNYFGHHGQASGQHAVIEVAEVRCVAGRGLVGDRFFDYQENYKGQVTFFSAEVFEQVCEELGVMGKSPAVTRRNIFTRGIDLSRLIGERFIIGQVEFEGVCECKPCYWMDEAIGPGAEAALQGRGGLRARILTDGIVRVSQ